MILKIDKPPFASELIVRNRNATTNCDLIITLRVWFEAYPKGTIRDLDNIEFSTENWQPAQFEEFKRKAVTEAARVWNEKIWLRTPDYYRELDWPSPPASTHVTNVHCGLRVELATGPAKAHAVVRAVKWVPHMPTEMVRRPKGFRSSANTWGHDIVLDEETSLARDSGITQVGAAHEVGHLLGLDHVGRILRLAACMDQPDSNASPCYGAGANAGGPDVARNIMGLGNQIKSYNAAPWQVRMAEHTQGATKEQHWTASTNRFPPRALGQDLEPPRERRVLEVLSEKKRP